jgi:Arc/MetJ-type ribon-helix-helix transcriptional regulator
MQRKTPKKPKRGRPATGHDQVITVRLPKALIRKLDKTAKAESKSRSEVIRALLDPQAKIVGQLASELIDGRLNERLSDEQLKASGSLLGEKQLAKITQLINKKETDAGRLASKELRAAVRRSKSGKPNA